MMAVHSLFVTLALAALAMLPGGPAQGQSPVQGCKPEQLGAQKAVDFGMAYAAADKRAKAWQADVVVVRLANGMLTCSTDEDAGRAVPAMKGDLYRDVKQVLATGAEKGGTADPPRFMARIPHGYKY